MAKIAIQLKVGRLEKGGQLQTTAKNASQQHPSASTYRPDVFAAIHGLNSENRVIKALAVATWGSGKLRKRSVLGQKAKKTGTDGRQPLSPEKVERSREEVTTCMGKRKRSADVNQVMLGSVSKFMRIVFERCMRMLICCLV